MIIIARYLVALMMGAFFLIFFDSPVWFAAFVTVYVGDVLADHEYKAKIASIEAARKSLEQ